MIYVAVSTVDLLGIAHADQIRGDAPANTFELGDDVTPQIRGSRIAMLENDRTPLANIHVRHLGPEN